MTTFLSIDPGGTTGWAIFHDGVPIQMGEADRKEFTQILIDTDVDYYVLEDFKLYAKNAWGKRWNPMTEVRVIGEVEHVAEREGRDIVYQMATIKELASKKFNLPNAGKHVIDALLHGYWHLRKDTKPDAEEQLSSQGGSANGGGLPRTTRIAQISSLGGLRAAGRDPSMGVHKERP